MVYVIKVVSILTLEELFKGIHQVVEALLELYFGGSHGVFGA